MKLALAGLLVAVTFSTYSQDFTSTTSGDWEDGGTWGNTSPGVIGTDFPASDGTDNVLISAGHVVTGNSNLDVNDLTITHGGFFRIDFNTYTVTVQGTADPNFSIQSGDAATNGNWVTGSSPASGDNVYISEGHTISGKFQGSGSTVTNFTIDIDAVFSTAKKCSVEGSMIVEGTYFLSNGSNENLTLEKIDGTGTLAGSGDIQVTGNGSATGNKMYVAYDYSIPSGSSLTYTSSLGGDIEMDNTGVTLTNNGTFILQAGNITKDGGGGTDPIVLNATNAFLELSGGIDTDVTLEASATDNTVIYKSLGDQTILQPASSYWNVTILGGGFTKTLEAATDINGDLFIGENSILSVSTFDLNLAGDWTSFGSFTEGTAEVILDHGTDNQTITNASGETFYDLTINKAGGDVNLANNITVTNTLTLTSGNVVTGNNKVIHGTGDAAAGSLSGGSTSSYVIGNYQKWMFNGTEDFPVGAANGYRLMEPTFTVTTRGYLIGQFIESIPGSAGFNLTDTHPDPDITLYNPFVEGYWDFSLPGTDDFEPTIGTYSVDLSMYGSVSFPINNAVRETTIIVRPNDASDWSVEGSVGTDSDPTIGRGGMSTFPAQYTFADGINCTRPVGTTITGDTDVCTTSPTENYSSDFTAGIDEYLWVVTGGTPATQDGTADNITVTWTTPGTQTVTLYLKVDNCSAAGEFIYSEPITKEVTVHSIAPDEISGRVVAYNNTDGYTYSIDDPISGYDYTWSITGNGTFDGTSSGTDVTSVTIDWGDVGDAQVSVAATYPGCSSNSTVLDVEIVSSIESTNSTNDWETTTTWSTGTVPLPNQNIKVLAGHTVNVTANVTEINNVYVESTGILSINSGGGSPFLEVTGDLIVNGTVTRSGTDQYIVLTGSANGPFNSIDGNGTISVPIHINDYSKEITAGASVTISDPDPHSNESIVIGEGLKLHNYGTASFDGDIEGTLGGSDESVVQYVNSTLNINGEIFTATSGTLDASATGNTVNYGGTGATNILAPLTDYYNLSISGGTKNLTAAESVLNNFTVSSGTYDGGNFDLSIGADFIQSGGALSNVGNFNIEGDMNLSGGTTALGGSTHTLAGDFINNGATVSSSGTVVFDGSAAQDIGGSAASAFNAVTLDNSNGLNLSSSANTTINGTLTLTNGSIDLNTSLLTANGDITSSTGTISSDPTGTLALEGTAAQALTAGSTFALGNLTLNSMAPGNAFTTNQPITLDGTLTLTDGIFLTDATNHITINTSAAYAPSGGSNDSFINGPMAYNLTGLSGSTEVTFPIGELSYLYHRADLIVDENAVYTAEYNGGSAYALGYTFPGNIRRISGVGYWTINSSITNSNTSVVELYYNDTNGVNDDASLFLLKDDGAGAWVQIKEGASGAPSGIITSDAFTGFSSFTLATDEVSPWTNPLPVELLYFKTEVTEKVNGLLTWATVTEVNNQGFYVEKSTDHGTTFNSIGFVEGHGDSDELIEYRFLDDEFRENTYYRFKQMDFDGEFEYGPTSYLVHPHKTEFEVFPNPVTSRFKIIMNDHSLISGHVYDLSGQILFGNEEPTDLMELENWMNDKFSDLPPGIYLLELIGQNNVLTKRLIKP